MVDLAQKRKNKKPRENGGRYGFDDYSGAPTITHDVPNFKPGDCCTACNCGKYYFGEDQKSLEITGGPIVKVTRHKKKVLRCNRCGDTKINPKKIIKWTPEARSAIVLHKIFGMPWYRMSRIQQLCGMPIAVSTFWHQGEGVWQDGAKSIVQVLYKYTAESATWNVDDTGMQIIEVDQQNKLLDPKEQRACHTTAICGVHEGYKIHLYITRNKYCRENWSELLAQRENQEKVVLMTDASKQSLPQNNDLTRVEPVGCLGYHGRRKFKDLETKHPEHCGFFLEKIGLLYQNEEHCKNLDANTKLSYHQQHSTAIIAAIYAKITELFTKKIVEPNSDLGGAMNYWLNQQSILTAFLRVAHAHLDNNWAEFALRLMAVYRNSSLFFKTLRSAAIMSDLFSLVSTCEANKINAFEYLNWIQRNWQAVQDNPEHYLPWHFKQATEKISASA